MAKTRGAYSPFGRQEAPMELFSLSQCGASETGTALALAFCGFALRL